MRGGDTARRMAEVERRLEWMDQHGTRGIDAIKGQLSEQATDISKIEAKLDGIQRAIAVRQTVIYFALLAPVYVLLFIDVAKAGHHG